MGPLAGFLWGCFGGLLAEGLHVRTFRFGDKPAWLSSPLYWVVTVVMVVLGGVLVIAYLQSSTKLTPLLAIQIGVSTPLAARSVVQAPQKVDVGKIL
jgi:hypothetical protein